MNNYYSMVRLFQEKVEQPCFDLPTLPSGDRRLLRFKMLVSEFAELVCALYGIGPEDLVCKGLKYNLTRMIFDHIKDAGVHDVDFANLARQICDVHFVLSGTSAEFGLPEDEVFVAVWEANMAKAGGPKRADGKQLPPPGWEEPDVQGVIQNYIDGYHESQ